MDNNKIIDNKEELKRYLDSLDSHTKVRIIFKNFESYVACYNDLAQYRSKFVLFQEKKDFMLTAVNQDSAVNNRKPLKESLQTYLSQNKVSEDIIKILMEEI